LDNKIGELFEKVKQLEVASFERAATVEKDATTVSLRKSDVSKWEIEMLAREKKYFKDIQAVKGHIKSFEDDCRRKEEEATQRLWEKEELLSQELKKKEEELALQTQDLNTHAADLNKRETRVDALLRSWTTALPFLLPRNPM
jgi:hypothetical protein